MGVRKRRVDIYTVTGEHVNVTNMRGKDEVKVKESKWDEKENSTFQSIR